MIHPTHQHYDKHRRTTTLFFDDHDSIECFMRGGICWPMAYEYNGQVITDGYAVMAGMDVRTKKVWVFEESRWVTIDDIIGENQQLQYRGLATWFNDVWSNYYANYFYWQQPYELTRLFQLQVYRSAMINPNPHFIEIEIATPADFIAAIWAKTYARLLKMEGGTILEKQLIMVEKGDKQVLPAVHALGCALLGMERYPWREPKDKAIEEVLIPAR